MNVAHLKYALEVERTGSISRAAQNLYMAQPHLSRAIRELEKDIGITLFARTPSGVITTSEGLEFLRYAKNIVEQIDELQAMYDPDAANRQKFDICVPRASYISCAFINFLKSFDFSKSVNVNYRETNSLKTIDNVANAVNKLGIIRYNKMYEKYFLNVLNERNLKYSVIWEFEYVLLMSENHPLAGRSAVDYRELEDCTEIVHGDPSVPALPITEVRERAKYDENKKRIHVYERASQFELLQQIPSAYMWVSPIPDSFVRRLSLVQRKCSIENNVYADLLIHRKGCRLHAHDKLFIENVRRVISEVQSER